MDAACLVVSEETGDVSIAVDGALKKYEDLTKDSSIAELFGAYEQIQSTSMKLRKILGQFLSIEVYDSIDYTFYYNGKQYHTSEIQAKWLTKSKSTGELKLRLNAAVEDLQKACPYSTKEFKSLDEFDLSDNKTISHKFNLPEEDTDFKLPLNNSSEIVAIKNYLKLNARMTTTTKVNPAEQSAIKNAIKTAIYESQRTQHLRYPQGNSQTNSRC